MTDNAPIQATETTAPAIETTAPATEATATEVVNTAAPETNILAKVAELAQRDANAATERRTGNAPEANHDEPQAEPPQAKPESKPDQVESRTQAYLERVVREERRLREERAQLQRQHEQYRQDLEAAKEYRELMQLAQTDPLKFAERAKINSDKLIESWMQEGAEKRPLTADERVDRLERQLQQEREAYAQRMQEQQAAANNAALQQRIDEFKSEIHNQAATNVERYELINIYRQENRVWNEVATYWQQHKVIPDLATVMDVVENQLRHDVRRLVGTKYFQSLQAESSAPTKAIINSAAHINRARQPASVQPRQKEQSEDERMNEIMARIRAFQSGGPS